LPAREAELEEEMEAVSNAQRVIKAAEQQVYQIKEESRAEMKQLQKKLGEVQVQLKDEQIKLRDREEDFNKMQEDYDSKIKELQVTLSNEQQLKESLEASLEEQTNLLTETQTLHDQRIEYVGNYNL
jgi:hypothetical protein